MKSLLNKTALTAPSINTLSGAHLARIAVQGIQEERNAGFWKAIANRSKDISASLTPSEMANIAYSFARMKLRDKSMMALLAESSIRKISMFNGADLTKILCAFARLEIRSDLLFNAASREAARKIDELGAREICDLCYSFSALNYTHPLLFLLVRKRIAALSAQLEPRHCQSLMSSFAKLKLTDNTLRGIMASVILKKIDGYSTNQLAFVAHAYSKGDVIEQDSSIHLLIKLLIDESYRKRSDFGHKEIAVLLNGLARLNVRQAIVETDPLVDYFAEKVLLKEAKKFDIQSLGIIVPALVRLGLPQRNSKLTQICFSAIADRFVILSPQSNPRVLAAVIDGYAKAGVIHDAMFRSFVSLATISIKSFSIDEISMFFGGLSVLGITDNALTDATLSALPELLKIENHPETQKIKQTNDFPVVSTTQDEVGDHGARRAPCSLISIVKIVEALSRMHLRDMPVLIGALELIARREDELRPDILKRLLSAYSTFDVGTEELARILKEKLLNPIWLQSAQPKDLQNMLHSLEPHKAIP